MADGAVLSLPQQNQADHNHRCYGHCDNKQANESTAPKAEVLPKRTEGFLLERRQMGEQIYIYISMEKLCSTAIFVTDALIV